VNAGIPRLASALKRRAVAGILEMVPGYRSLLILFDPLLLFRNILQDLVADLVNNDDFGDTFSEGGGGGLSPGLLWR